jgi:lambda family phage portal protein
VPTTRILDARGNPIAREPRRSLSARYDAAERSVETDRHWANADLLSARAANNPEVRRRLRERARYEAGSNCYCDGIVQTLANDAIGNGPSIQLQTGDDEADSRIEQAFCEWAEAITLPDKLRTMRRARAVDGEAFGLHITNPKLPTDVKLDFLLIEADQFATPYTQPLDLYMVDGIEFDRAWNPTFYHLLKVHPGDMIGIGYAFEYDRLPASSVSHWFERKRPQQFRGIPDITAALPLFAQLRRYTLAVLAAAETAADFAAVLYSELPPDDSNEDAKPFEALEINRRMMTTLPAGWKMGQFRAEQPTTTYPDFKREILNEIARCVLMPYNVAAGNSSSYNYSSGRLDHQVYYRALDIDRGSLERCTLNPLFAAWVAEAGGSATRAPAMPGLIPEGADLSPTWLWPALENIDPEKEANAVEILMRNGLTSFSEECRRQGVDPETRVAQMAKDAALFERYGLPMPSAWSGAGSNQSPPSGGGNADPSSNPGGQEARNGHARNGLLHGLG